jgi:protein-S-isoprenylcysteine O-methyltransferase Ste14
MNGTVFFTWLQWIWISIGVLTFAGLFFIAAPYGRHARSGWGPLIDARLGWLIMEVASPLFLCLAYFAGLEVFNPVTLLFILLWVGHYVNRALLYPLRMNKGSHPMPLSVVAMATFFNLVNGYLNGRYLNLFGERYTPAWFRDPRFLFGTALFFTGILINLQSDGILRNLRSNGESGYKIPRGKMFEVVSCPNYLGEIVEWLGFAVLTWSLAGLTFALWTAANLVPRARAHHEWYRRNFPDYPVRRKAIIPYLF